MQKQGKIHLTNMEYAVVVLSGRQYLIRPGETIKVDKLAPGKSISVNEVLLAVDGENVEIGTPYLKETIEFEVLGDKVQDKIRVAKYSAKANSRRVKGHRAVLTEVVWKKDKKFAGKS